MIYIFGDSHGMFSLKNLSLPHINKATPSVTMHRVGRDNNIINYQNEYDNENNVIILCFGEVDCRCHIEKQKHIQNIDEDIIISILVYNYFNTIQNNIKQSKKIIIFAIIPPVDIEKYINKHGDYANKTHPFPVLGTNNDRIRYTNKMNNLLKYLCDKHSYIYFDPYNFYKDEMGCLNEKYADDTLVHVKDNDYIINEMIKLINSL
jgi:hypothetical protein